MIEHYKLAINFAEREGFEPPIPKGYTAFRVQRIQPGSAISPNKLLNLHKENYSVIIPNTKRRVQGVS